MLGDELWDEYDEGMLRETLQRKCVLYCWGFKHVHLGETFFF
jgi:hypothetical protein